MSGILTTPTADRLTAVRITESALATSGVASLAELQAWLAERRRTDVAAVERVPLDDLERWHTDPGTGNIVHDTGKFFRIEGLSAQVGGAAVPAWTQPVVNQPEIGILGILAKEFDGILHFLMQAKNEPGNFDGVEISPTVQATRSNYTQVHRGNPVPYLEYFRDSGSGSGRAAGRHRVVADVLQSEQGAWFFQKRNRNIVVETEEDVEVLDGFAWFTLGQIHLLLARDAVVNMDARTVLSCLPFSGAGLAASFPFPGQDFRNALLRSCSDDAGGLLSTGAILSWITETRTRQEVRAGTVPLRDVEGWVRAGGTVSHESGLFFNVMGISVRAGHREIGSWCQPMVEPIGIGVNAFLVKRVDGVLHALVHARVQPGYLDVTELAPTVQATPGNYSWLPAAARPRFLDEVLAAPPEAIRYDSLLSEEGGRFYHARNRYLVIETDPGHAEDPGADFRWLTLHQLVGLLRHSHYVNVEARSLIACLHSLSGAAG
ncbi:NDP-hexose 2,3-dehydratase family protein [Actinacidiphila paucisporea]|uniref:Oxidase EvaA n=1 Tax=Actinacidiphila paucisporea TaxID=310782 RepID=A0A1M7QFM4_9ACTN|nr:NDP-hexose 2,3-dehydratase family protein [Actinacidiphila paucisporea]SHN29423.1 oxidase EvaA [Actinacidiphila paucisporea]